MEHASLTVTEHALSSLAAAYEEAGIGAGDLDYYSTAHWFENLAANCPEPGETLTVLSAGGVVLPLRLGRVRLGPLACRRARGLSNFYSCRFAPPGLEHASDPVAAMAMLGGDLRRRRLDSLWFDALDAGPKDQVAQGLRQAGWIVEPFSQFGNWYLSTTGLDFETYWQRRPGALRNTGQRRSRAFLKAGGGRIARFAQPEDADAAIAAYEAVYATSWQPAEPYPAFLPGLIRQGLADGEVTVWCLFAGERPVAAQIWVRRHGRATIFKLAYDQDWGRQSVGTVLTMEAMRATLSDPGIHEIDFGWGDDPYKREWLPDRRQRYGVAAYNPRRWIGLTLAIRNLAKQKLRSFLE